MSPLVGRFRHLDERENWEQGLSDMVVLTLSTTLLSDKDSEEDSEEDFEEDTTELDCAIEVYV